MFFLIGFMIVMGLVDSLNPFSIAVHIFLLGILKNPNRIVLYVLGILLVYLLGGIAIFSGLTVIFNLLLEQFALIPQLVLYLVEAFLGVVLAVYGIVEYSKPQQSQMPSAESDVAGWKLFFLGAGGTLADLPTALPYLGFIAKMTEAQIDVTSGTLLLLVYNFIYILPLLIIWRLFLWFRDGLRNKMEAITHVIERANRYILVAFCEIIGGFFIVDALFFFLGNPIQW
jgi:cytochrome c biogenesis protein CcdA